LPAPTTLLAEDLRPAEENKRKCSCALLIIYTTIIASNIASATRPTTTRASISLLLHYLKVHRFTVDKTNTRPIQILALCV
jgi:hypothetical protein